MAQQLPPPRLGVPSVLQGLLIALAPERYPQWLLGRYRGRTMVELRVPGLGPVVSVTDPNAFRELARGCPAGAANARVLAVLGQRSVLLLDGEEHLRMRRLLSPAFHGEAIERYREVVLEVAGAEVASWPAGEVVPLLPRMQAITREVILRAVLGSDDDELRVLLRRVLRVNPFVVMAEGRYPRLGRVRTLPWIRARRRAHALLAATIAERRAAGADGDALLDVLLREAPDLTDRDLRDQLFALLLAGQDTTATTLGWCLELLLRHPAALRRAREDDAFLTACIEETLRVRPPLDVAWRLVDRDLEVGGHTLRAGTLVMLALRAIQRLPAVYEDAATWDPGRQRPLLVPFGGGPRRCLGAGFAQMELHAVLRTVLHHVDLAPVSRRPERQSRLRTITTVPARGARARIVRLRCEDGATCRDSVSAPASSSAEGCASSARGCPTTGRSASSSA